MILTKAKLKKDFGAHAVRILDGHLKPLPRKRKQHQKFEVIKPLPSLEEFTKMRLEKFTITLDALASDAGSELESLRDELRSWYDNLPEAFQQGDKGSQLEDAIGQLDRAGQPDLLKAVAVIETVYIPMEDATSRADRRDEACFMLQTVLDELQSALDDLESGDSADPDKAGKKDERRDEIQVAMDEIERMKDEADGVEFPGMY